MKCKGGHGAIKEIIVYNESDWKLDSEGRPVLKRKYGKFKREPIYYKNYERKIHTNKQ